MKFTCTLEELNTFVIKVFNQEAVKHLRFEVDIQTPGLRNIVKTYPVGLPDAERVLYDTALNHLPLGRIPAIKAVREISNLGLKEGRDFVEKWFPDAPTL